MPGAVGIGLLLLACASALGQLGAREVAGLRPEEAAGLAGAGAALLLVLNGVGHRFRAGFGEGLFALAVWGAVGAGGAVLYTYRDQARDMAFRALAEMNPGQPVPGRGEEVVIARRIDGGFTVQAKVNGRGQSFAFDTGASAVVLTAETAAALGIHPGPAAYRVQVQTANGRTAAAPVVLDTVAVGPITETRVAALVTRPGALSVNLLGMSFLERLASYEVRGSRLILRGARG
ncbi:retropepsin-like aspartic protease family protein [Methylobacterium platani]|uniref:Histidine kinase n=2 Tax=Methylobacterium platani TaxID=427683 RepID=A0A179S8R0_9HYPH|nr:TIGR02281 family clan AA aspartic protease [Methylobacterium platani]KMO20249.1 histidine kinase [Methylobacterium platani JCM 14648]OAS24064.1 histidine kinase [Methylobacterium platani]